MGSSVKSAKHQLSEKLSLFPERVVCWGNTNLQAADYKHALREAYVANRPVKFIRWFHRFSHYCVQKAMFKGRDVYFCRGCELPSVPLEELLRRNILRFLETGK